MTEQELNKIIDELKNDKGLPKLQRWASESPERLKEVIEALVKENPGVPVESLLAIYESDLQHPQVYKEKKLVPIWSVLAIFESDLEHL